MSWFSAEISLLDNYIVVYKFVQDLHFFVTGGDDENELILATVLQGFFDAVTILLRLLVWRFWTLLLLLRLCLGTTPKVYCNVMELTYFDL